VWVLLGWWQQRLYTELLNEFLAAERGEEPEGEAATDPLALGQMGFNIEHADTPQDPPPRPPAT
jgi:hypothetical protein